MWWLLSMRGKMSRKGYEFSDRVKDEVYRRQRSSYPADEEVEVDHIVSVRECKQKGIPQSIASSIVNAQLLSKKENREKSDDDADPGFVDYLLSLMTRLF